MRQPSRDDVATLASSFRLALFPGLNEASFRHQLCNSLMVNKLLLHQYVFLPHNNVRICYQLLAPFQTTTDVGLRFMQVSLPKLEFCAISCPDPTLSYRKRSSVTIECFLGCAKWAILILLFTLFQRLYMTFHLLVQNRDCWSGQPRKHWGIPQYFSKLLVNILYTQLAHMCCCSNNTLAQP